ncbi:hypothetical protein NW767_014008 [Fusarium falciforme]|nr:hypothetical protein NW767_014008 [Fusarium falciforme]
MQNGRLSEETFCQFHFPRATRPQAILSRNFNPNYPVYYGARNDTKFDNFNRTLIMPWLANINTSLCTSKPAVINYVVKYVGKAEKKSNGYKGIAQAILSRVNANRGVVGFVAKFMNRLIGERETGLSRKFNIHCLTWTYIKVQEPFRPSICRHPHHFWKADFVPESEDEVRSAKNPYQKYLGRPNSFKNCSNFHFLAQDDFSKRPQEWREFSRASPPAS